MRNHQIPASPIVTLTTDFGTSDCYVGAMKGVIHSIAPHARVVDISHDIQPQNVLHGSFVLRHSVLWYPAGTIHVCVVDPGVGTDRRILAAQFEGQRIITPDNGLITFLQNDCRLEVLRVVENQRLTLANASSTFHGRDIMAPVAAHLANGTPFDSVGPETDQAELLRIPVVERLPDRRIRGHVLYTDRFGNLITNIKREDLGQAYGHRYDVQVSVNGRAVGPIHPSYGSVARGEWVALVGSSGYVEISINGGSASERLKPEPDCVVEIG